MRWANKMNEGEKPDMLPEQQSYWVIEGIRCSGLTEENLHQKQLLTCESSRVWFAAS